jgi:hypothetical protein
MRRVSNDMRELARMGAEVRLRELQAEIERLRTQFPGLTSSPANDENADPGRGRATKPRKLSAAGRQAIVVAARRRWAKFRAEKATSSATTGGKRQPRGSAQ